MNKASMLPPKNLVRAREEAIATLLRQYQGKPFYFNQEEIQRKLLATGLFTSIAVSRPGQKPSTDEDHGVLVVVIDGSRSVTNMYSLRSLPA